MNLKYQAALIGFFLNLVLWGGLAAIQLGVGGEVPDAILGGAITGSIIVPIWTILCCRWYETKILPKERG